MARFKLFLIGTPQPLDVEFLASSVSELMESASRARFIEGHMAEPDPDGVYPGVVIPTCRLQMILEVN